MESFWSRASPRGGSSPCSSLGLAVVLQEWKNTHVTRHLPDGQAHRGMSGLGRGRARRGAKPSGAPDNRDAKGGSRRAAGPEPRPGSAAARGPACSRCLPLRARSSPRLRLRALLPGAPTPRAPGGRPGPARSSQRPRPRPRALGAEARGGRSARPGRGPPARRGCWECSAL